MTIVISRYWHAPRLWSVVSGTEVDCDHTVQLRSDLSLWLDGAIIWASCPNSISICAQPSFSNSIRHRIRSPDQREKSVISLKRLKIELQLLFGAIRKSYMARRLAQRSMTLSDLEWSFRRMSAS